jgi:hypothetical protein
MNPNDKQASGVSPRFNAGDIVRDISTGRVDETLMFRGSEGGWAYPGKDGWQYQILYPNGDQCEVPESRLELVCDETDPEVGP